MIRGATNRRTRKGYNRGSIEPNDFLGRAERLSSPLVISSLSDLAQAGNPQRINKLPVPPGESDYS